MPAFRVRNTNMLLSKKHCAPNVSVNKGVVTNYGEGGGVQNGRGGHVKFYPYEKGGRKKF